MDLQHGQSPIDYLKALIVRAFFVFTRSFTRFFILAAFAYGKPCLCLRLTTSLLTAKSRSIPLKIQNRDNDIVTK